jgi:hypothetical protein
MAGKDQGRMKRIWARIGVGWMGLAALALAVGVSRPAVAVDGERQPRASAPAAALGSADPARAGAALDALGERGGAAAVETLSAYLRQGQTDALTDRALLALGKRGARESLPVLVEFTRHRRPSARLAAYTGIARIKGEAADGVLAQGLRDSAAEVRGLCARSLAERGAKGQLDMLFRAFVRGVPEASFAIGRLGDAGSVVRFEQQLNRLPLAVMLAGYEQFLLRDDISEPVKLELVAHLGEVASPPVRRFLEQMLAAKKWSKQPYLQRALLETAKRIDPKTQPSPSPRPGAGR